MSLIEQLGSIPTGELRAAEKLRNRGEVTIHGYNAERVQAVVYTTYYQRLAVEIGLDGRRIEWYQCDCGHATAKAPCRHVYAVAADYELIQPAMAAPGVPPPTPAWQRRFRGLSRVQRSAAQGAAVPPQQRDLAYFIELAASADKRKLVIAFAERRILKNGTMRAKRRSIDGADLARISDPADRHILSMLRGAGTPEYAYRYYGAREQCSVVPEMYDIVLPALAATGRLYANMDASEEFNAIGPLTWDDGPAWEFWLRTTKDDKRQAYVMTGALQRDGKSMSIGDPLMIVGNGLIVGRQSVARLNARGS
ncbi:MAG: hypothetical protein ABSH20_24880, partial [Tepidisphaeraceae bacterium]